MMIEQGLANLPPTEESLGFQENDTASILRRFASLCVSIVQNIESPKPILFSREDLKDFTGNFDERNLIGETEFGKVYRGTIKQSLFPSEIRDVAVKIWDQSNAITRIADTALMVEEEVMFLTEPSVKCHPNVVKLIGYCNEDGLEGVVYDINALDIVHNLTTKGSFTWLERIKVALGFARILEFLHERKNPYFVRNIDAAHIILDQDGTPKIFDFGLMSGGIIGEMIRRKERIYYSLGYADPTWYPLGGLGVTYHDVFSFGVVLLGLITKRIVNKKDPSNTFVYKWAKSKYTPNCSLVHESLVKDYGFYALDGQTITELGMRCTDYDLDKRPTMKEVVQCLEGLQAVQLHGNAFGM